MSRIRYNGEKMSPSPVDILLRPDAFFEQIIKEKESLKVPALILLAGSIVAVANGYMMGALTAKMMAGAMAGAEAIIYLSVIIVSFIGVFVIWFIAAGIFHLVSGYFGGQGSFNRVLEVVGYGYLPQIAGSLITLVAAIEYLPRVTVPVLTKSALEDPEVIEAATKALMHDPAMMEFTQISSLIAIVFLLWSANIWIFGIKHARSITMRDAALSVGVPVVLYVIYLIYNIGAM
jgi:hypothetical protein